jgi:hypothetical protein
MTRRPEVGLLCDPADDVRCRMQWMVLDACRKSQMHDQDIRAFREIDELGVGSHLIRAEDDRLILDLYTIGKRRHIAVRDSTPRSR